MPTRVINIVATAAPLLSSDILSDCQTAEDPTCQGGIAAVAAYARHYSQNDPVLILPQLDRQSQFVQAHPMGWSVNKKVLQEYFGLTVVSTNTPSLLLLNDNDNNSGLANHGVVGLQSPDMPLLLSNVAVPPSNPWSPYLESVHFDEATGIALVSLVRDDKDNDNNANIVWPQVESAVSALDYIAAQNKRRNCPTTLYSDSDNKQEQQPELLQEGTTASARNNNQTETTTTTTARQCWIPVIFAHSRDSDALDRLVAAVATHAHPPALVLDLNGVGDQDYTGMPQVFSSGTWVVSQPLSTHGNSNYLHAKLIIDDERQKLVDLAMIAHDLQSPLPSDQLLENNPNYVSDIAFLRGLADQAMANDPPLGMSDSMVTMTSSDSNSNSCTTRECEMGNLVADSLRQATNTDIALVAGNTLQGPGWSSRTVKTSDIWKALPKAATICTGKITGAKLLQTLDVAYSDDDDGSQSSSFLQVSRLKIALTTQSEAALTRLVSVKVWDSDKDAHVNVNPLRWYTLTTEGAVCTELMENADQAAELVSSDTLIQNIVGGYLRQQSTLSASSTYQPLLEGRLQKGAGLSMDLNSETDACGVGNYWQAEQLTCLACPNKRAYVTLSESWMELSTQRGTKDTHTGRVVVINRDLHDFVLISKDLPPWFQFTSESTLDSNRTIQLPDVLLKLPGGEKVAFDYAINTTAMPVGVTFSTIFFNVTDFNPIPGCFSDQYSLPLDTFIQVTPADAKVDLGSLAGLGLAMMGAILAVCVGLLSWVFLRKERWGYGNLGEKVVMSIQPMYLATLCMGVLIMALSIAPLSIDNPVTPSAACLAIPWLLSLGLTLVFSALLSKLATAKKRVVQTQPNLREIQISAKDLGVRFIVLFGVNFFLLLCMLIDPPTRGQEVAQGEDDWKFYGVCQYNPISSALTYTSGIIHILTLCYIGVQVYVVGALIGDWRELKSIGLSVFLWLQMIIIVLPFWFILDNSNVAGKYFFKVASIGALCLSMLACIFVPVLSKAMDAEQVKLKRTSDDNKGGVGGGDEIFGGFLGFTTLTGGNGNADPMNTSLPMAAHEDKGVDDDYDDDNDAEGEGNRCLADRFCY